MHILRIKCEEAEISDAHDSREEERQDASRTQAGRGNAREQGVSPHEISYAWRRIRGLIAPPHNVNMPRQLTVQPRVYTHA